MVTVLPGPCALVPLFCLLGVVTGSAPRRAGRCRRSCSPTAVRGRAQGLGSGLQRFSIGVNVLIVPHMLAGIGFRATVLLAAGISVAFIPLALWGRRFEPARKIARARERRSAAGRADTRSPPPRSRAVERRHSDARCDRDTVERLGDVAHRQRDRAEHLGFGAELAEHHRVAATARGRDPRAERLL